MCLVADVEWPGLVYMRWLAVPQCWLASSDGSGGGGFHHGTRFKHVVMLRIRLRRIWSTASLITLSQKRLPKGAANDLGLIPPLMLAVASLPSGDDWTLGKFDETSVGSFPMKFEMVVAERSHVADFFEFR